MRHAQVKALERNLQNPRTRITSLSKAILYPNSRRWRWKLLELALKDELTGLYNRRGFTALAQQNLRTARRLKRQLLLFFMDVDGLKQINDHFGHLEGDQALRRVARCIKYTFRKSDVTARLGGDEFVAITLDHSDCDIESIRRRLHVNLSRSVRATSRYSLTLSVGVARLDPSTKTSLRDLLAAADRRLYAHKRALAATQITNLRSEFALTRQGLH